MPRNISYAGIYNLDAESLAKFQRDRIAIVSLGPLTPRPKDEVDMRALLGDLTERPVHEVGSLGTVLTMNQSPHSATVVTTTLAWPKVLGTVRLYHSLVHPLFFFNQKLFCAFSVGASAR